ncbi:MAG: serine O-acetyltransferase [Hyalangium sp.]|uniref:serine O-acetyltransferase n=1 Tax=Hyalangium sp. TaxID=2028555 RepID=UPI003899D2BE
MASRIVRKLGTLLYSAYLPDEAEIGEHTVLGYSGIGVFIHPRARIGRHCLISHFVSLGGMGGKEGAPVLGDYVRIGTGARILGPVRIGDFAVVGANSVVVRDVPAGTVVFGIPARVVRTLSDPAGDYERETGLPVAVADRDRAPRPRPQRSRPPGASVSGRNELRTDEDPGLFDIGAPLLSEQEAPAPKPPPVPPPESVTLEWPAGEPSPPDSPTT